MTFFLKLIQYPIEDSIIKWGVIMPKEYILDRETYRKIKKMSREELQAFLMHYANELLEDQKPKLDLHEIENDLRQINGIGQKRLEEIMTVIENYVGTPE